MKINRNQAKKFVKVSLEQEMKQMGKKKSIQNSLEKRTLKIAYEEIIQEIGNFEIEDVDNICLGRCLKQIQAKEICMFQGLTSKGLAALLLFVRFQYILPDDLKMSVNSKQLINKIICGIKNAETSSIFSSDAVESVEISLLRIDHDFIKEEIDIIRSDVDFDELRSKYEKESKQIINNLYNEKRKVMIFIHDNFQI